MDPHPHKPAPAYDVIVVGSGPAGCEASLAAGMGGAHTLCLTINLDTTGYPPGSPVLVKDAKDNRYSLLEEMETIGIMLPRLTGNRSMRDNNGGAPGQIIVDRRELGLAYKEQVESADNVELRQALVTSLEPASGGWTITSRLGEQFRAPCVVIAAGTFLQGKVTDANHPVPGGRRGEIPSNALALSLQNLGFQFVEAQVSSAPRLDSRSITRRAGGSAASGKDLPADGSQLNELYGAGFEPTGDRKSQFAAASTGNAWMTRTPYSVNHLILTAHQVSPSLESVSHSGLFFAGRVAGCSGYVEAAALGLIAGHNADRRSSGKEPEVLPPEYVWAGRLCNAVSSRKSRPVSVACSPGNNTT